MLQEKSLFKFNKNHKKEHLFKKDLVLGGFVIALSLAVNLFYIPIQFGIGGLEKTEIGSLIPICLIGIINNWVLVFTIVILPLIDAVFHGHFHFPIFIPLDMIFNFLIILFLIFLNKILNFFSRKENKVKKIVIFFFGFTIANFLKVAYLLIGIYLVTGKFLQLNVTENIFEKTVFLILFFINAFNFFIIFFAHWHLRESLLRKKNWQ